ncbi:MAG: hypothetical protein IPI85_02080 [Dehalococcoidia bacterium]|nr:hypothetical protein [Dehalococcoidia bacterium]
MTTVVLVPWLPATTEADPAAMFVPADADVPSTPTNSAAAAHNWINNSRGRSIRRSPCFTTRLLASSGGLTPLASAS